MIAASDEPVRIVVKRGVSRDFYAVCFTTGLPSIMLRCSRMRNDIRRKDHFLGFENVVSHIRTIQGISNPRLFNIVHNCEYD